jgi:hypothetical protein
MTNKQYFRVKRDSGTIFEFSSINPAVEENLDENKEVISPENSDHSYWVNYEEHYLEYEEDSVQKAMWTFSINGVNYGDLESLKIGVIYRPSIPRLLPSVDFGTENPNYYVFDFELNEWKSPSFDLDGIKIWDTEKKEYVPLPSN